jgi:deazaflavin-dependent oxidoreductase (nitroreductase family)
MVMVDVKEFMASLQPFFDDHLKRYLADGDDGHYIDAREFGGSEKTATLLLTTIGRKSGREFVTPLIYTRFGDEYAIVASKGGMDAHPAWYLNLMDRPEVKFQVATDSFEGSWRVLGSEERADLWDKLVDYYPPYAEYEARTDRKIPVIMLKARSQASRHQ